MSRPSKASRRGRDAGRTQARPRCRSGRYRHAQPTGTPLCGEARYEHVGLASPKPGCGLCQTTATGRSHKGRRSRANRRTTRHSRLPYGFRGHLNSSHRTGGPAVSRPLRTVRRRGRSHQAPGTVRQRAPDRRLDNVLLCWRSGLRCARYLYRVGVDCATARRVLAAEPEGRSYSASTATEWTGTPPTVTVKHLARQARITKRTSGSSQWGAE